MGFVSLRHKARSEWNVNEFCDSNDDDHLNNVDSIREVENYRASSAYNN